ncbi:gamma-glutamylcyclotransferase family protein [Paenibacillus sacheonensis]|uniref:gamma-glutamylcyclotransferase family protein n=1 Tax=Paenibacillus sacheonensis TaxID=742054 RepID=UPI001EF98705|nr:gamma-glutamylcyclotransferase family protein [Paenibacillus sacheonensis]
MNERRFTVFIYGSLLPGQANHHVAAPFIRDQEPGRIRGRLVDCGSYPALLRDEEADADGMAVRGLWITVDEQGLRQMDELEAFYGSKRRMITSAYGLSIWSHRQGKVGYTCGRSRGTARPSRSRIGRTMQPAGQNCNKSYLPVKAGDMVMEKGNNSSRSAASSLSVFALFIV